MKVPNKEELRTREQILEDFGCPVVPFDENVTMYYPAILSAMDEYRSQGEQEAMEKVIGELVEWMEEMKSSGSSVYYPLTLKYCIQKAKSLLKQEGEYAAMQNEQTKDVCRCAVPLGKKGNCQRCGGQIWF